MFNIRMACYTRPLYVLFSKRELVMHRFDRIIHSLYNRLLPKRVLLEWIITDR